MGKHQGLACSWWTLNKVEQICRVRQCHRLDLAFIEISILQFLAGALVAGIIYFWCEGILKQGQDRGSSQLRIGNGVQSIKIKWAGVEPILVHDPAFRSINEEIFVAAD